MGLFNKKEKDLEKLPLKNLERAMHLDEEEEKELEEMAELEESEEQEEKEQGASRKGKF